MKNSFSNNNIVAPCGMDCGVCIAYLRDEKTCCGCNNDGEKPKHCISCIIKNCVHLDRQTGFCYNCTKFPCTRLKQLDARYRKNYQTSLILNLEEIKQDGIEVFLKNEKEKWTCPHCDATLSIHRKFCLKCKVLTTSDEQ